MQTKLTKLSWQKASLSALFALLLAFSLSGLTGCDFLKNGFGGSSGDSGGQASSSTTITYNGDGTVAYESNPSAPSGDAAAELADIPEYSGAICIEINESIPGFSSGDLQKGEFLSFTDLDWEGRCGTAFGMLGPETVSDEKRGDISSIHPSGWEQKHYSFIEGGVLFTRSHLIAHQLSGENANERNLISGTKTFNSDAMTYYEELVGDYIRDTGNHVLYRVTPLFAAYDLVARGVQMEALSVEDGGEAICYNVFIYNIEPGVEIDYVSGESHESSSVVEVSSWGEATQTTGKGGRAARALAYGETAASTSTGSVSSSAASASGDSSAASSGDSGSSTSSGDSGSGTSAAEASSGASSGDSSASAQQSTSSTEARDYVLNTGSKKFHYPTCDGVADISSYNRKDYNGTRESLIAEGYTPCGQCNP